ncbi:S1C family serine protease [Maribacter aestuarii]|uniref:S1C family serine protease n=1 Tax=Maribacter aestuarii TaxID=1130723 RepID=UPI00248C2881|nr:trypsin-like peptidase domain-containing protein [Maribacter aestuarii]
MTRIKLIVAFFWLTFGFSQSLSKLYNKVSESVVLIKTWQPRELGRGELSMIVPLEGIGSGFVVSNEGDIMTASHIVQRASLVRVKFSDGEELPAKVVYSYPFADVALIRLTEQKSTPLSVAHLTDSDDVKIGDQVFLIGAPFGLGHSLSVGYVSGIHARPNFASGFPIAEFIQTDAAVNEGSSGGPLFNMKGQVIGVASFILSNSHGFQGVSFAATSNIAQELLGEEHPIWIGIDATILSGSLAEIFNLPQEAGILVQNVAPFSLGEAMGLYGGYSK